MTEFNQTGKNILVLFAKDTNSVFSRKSALGSYILSLCALMKEYGNHKFYINGVDNDVPKSTITSIVEPISNSKFSFIKKTLPEKIIRVAKDIRLLNQHLQLEKKLKNLTNIDVVLEFYSYGSLVGYNLSKRLNVPLIVIYDAPIIDEYVFFNHSLPFFFNKVKLREKRTLIQASSIVVYSNPMKDYIFKITRNKSNIRIHQNVDFTRFDIIKNREFNSKINIGFIGSFLRWHRVDLLIEVYTKLKKQGKDVALYLLGDGEEFHKVKKEVELNEFSKDIFLTGFVDNKELSDLKQKIDIGVMPSSNWYGAPNKIFEYAASSMAVVAPDTPTIVDLFENENELLLFKNESSEELYIALLKLIENPQLMNYLSLNLQNKIKQKYSKSNTFNFYNEILLTLK